MLLFTAKILIYMFAAGILVTWATVRTMRKKEIKGQIESLPADQVQLLADHADSPKEQAAILESIYKKSYHGTDAFLLNKNQLSSLFNDLNLILDQKLSSEIILHLLTLFHGIENDSMTAHAVHLCYQGSHSILIVILQVAEEKNNRYPVITLFSSEVELIDKIKGIGHHME